MLPATEPPTLTLPMHPLRIHGWRPVGWRPAIEGACSTALHRLGLEPCKKGGGGRLHRFIIARVFVALQEEMQRGYFDDFRDFRDSQGKVFAAPQRLVAASNVRAAEGQEG